MVQEHDKNKPKKDNFYFVDNVKYETDLPSITGALIKAKIPNFDPTYALFLEGVGNEPDQLVNDDTVVPLDKDHGPRRLHTVPPATFGGNDTA